jgi:hypothetical protein
LADPPQLSSPAPSGPAQNAQSQDVFGGARDFVSSIDWTMIRNLVLFAVAVFWAATAYWTYKDARRRIDDPWLLAVAVVLGCVPFVGPLVYMLFRPPEYVDDVVERTLELRLLEQSAQEHRCPACGASSSPAFLVCPTCSTRLRNRCGSCREPVERSWRMCPYCEAPVALPAADEPPSRRPAVNGRTASGRAVPLAPLALDQALVIEAAGAAPVRMETNGDR